MLKLDAVRSRADVPRSTDDQPTHYRVLSIRAIVWAGIVIFAIGIGLATALLLAYGSGDPGDRNRLEAIKTAGTIVVGAGGATALLLAARRQRSLEIALKQKDRDQQDAVKAHSLQERVAAATEADAVERRITELYARASEQLGNSTAAVRLAGLYALERLAQGSESQRQTIASVVCAYLRMPYSSPPRELPAKAPSHDWLLERQEREVRLTAQAILRTHLRWRGEESASRELFWDGIDIDLTGATLIDFDMASCKVRTGRFGGATFVGPADFQQVQFSASADFRAANFNDTAKFRKAEFAAGAMFAKTAFNDAGGDPWFPAVEFDKVQFRGTANYHGAVFAGYTSFSDAVFHANAYFSSATFGDHVDFHRVQFKHSAPSFMEGQFVKGVDDSLRNSIAIAADDHEPF